MVIGQTLDIVIQGIQTRRGQKPGLTHAAPDHFAQTPGLADQLGRAAQHRTDRRTQAFGQAYRHGIEVLGDFPRINTQFDGCVI
ncbi:hypothetical protein D3C76_1807910 [compost metagenome]